MSRATQLELQSACEDLAGAAWLIAPALAQTNALTECETSLPAGFTHPLLGWDHFARDARCGRWAAQLGGQALWPILVVLASAEMISHKAKQTLPEPRELIGHVISCGEYSSHLR